MWELNKCKVNRIILGNTRGGWGEQNQHFFQNLFATT